jgi:nitronate monooxygenase
MKTRVTERLGIQVPIVEGGMQWVGRAQLAAAVSNTGALGMLSALTQPTPDALLQEIRRCRALTDKPFAVNVTMLRAINPPPFQQYFEAIVEGGVRIVETAGNVPEEVFGWLKARGVAIIHKCTSVRHALAAERRGVDIVSIDGMECAGHPGEDDVPGLVLIPAAVRALSIPVIASGGIADGRGMAAALALGAEGVNMGTRFVCTQEAQVHDNIKQAMLKAGERDTLLIMRTLNNSARVLRNAISEQVVALERRPGGAVFEDIRPFVAGARGKEALASGEVDNGVVWSGQVVGLIDDMPSCAELVSRMVSQCRERLVAALAMVAP